MHTRSRNTALIVATLLMAVACGDDGPTEPTPEPQPKPREVASVTLAPEAPEVDDGATVQLTATLLDQDGTAFTSMPEGVTLAWSSADTSIASVDAKGLVTGNHPGTVAVTATAAGKSASVDVVVRQIATTLSLLAGDEQEGTAGTALEDTLVVRVTDRHGDPVEGVTVSWTVTAGVGTLEAVAEATDAEGHARAVWTLGAEEGQQTAEASAEGLDGSPVVFTATAAPAIGEFSEAQEVVGMRTLVHHEGRYYQVFHDNSTGDYDVYLRSSEGGATWSPRVRVSDGPSETVQRNASIAIWGSGEATRIAVSYYDGREPNPQLRVAVSTDGGATFAPSVQVSDHTDNNNIIGSIAVGDDGVLYAAWSRQYAGDRWDHIWFSRSTDGGATWSTPDQILNSGHYGHDTHVVAGPAGQVWVAVATSPSWRKDIVVLRSTDGGGTWESTNLTNNTQSYWHAEHPSLLRTSDGTLHAIWQDTRGWLDNPSHVRTSRSTDGGATWSPAVLVSDSVELGVADNPYNGRTRPSLAVGDDGTLYAVWADDREGPTNSHDTKNYDIYLSRSTDGGQTWSTDERVNGMPEVHEQSHAAIATGPGGALVVWNDLRLDPYRRLLHRLIP